MKKIIMSHVDLGVNISTLVEMFIPGENIYTWFKCLYPGANISTWWKYFFTPGCKYIYIILPTFSWDFGQIFQFLLCFIQFFPWAALVPKYD